MRWLLVLTVFVCAASGAEDIDDITSSGGTVSIIVADTSSSFELSLGEPGVISVRQDGLKRDCVVMWESIRHAYAIESWNWGLRAYESLCGQVRFEWAAKDERE